MTNQAYAHIKSQDIVNSFTETTMETINDLTESNEYYVDDIDLFLLTNDDEYAINN